MKAIILAFVIGLAMTAHAQRPAEILQRARECLELDSIDKSKTYYFLYQDRTGDYDSDLECQYAQKAYNDSTYFLAVHWYDQAAKHGNGEAAATLFEIYRQGINGIPQDTVVANQYYRQAIELGANVKVLSTRPHRTQKPKQPTQPEPQQQKQQAQQPATAVKSQPEPKPETNTMDTTVVYDEIAPGQSLAALAKKHYGNGEFWVYIYLENQDKIKNPNNVAVGTRLVIPPLSKYATAPSMDDNLKDARIKAAEILRKV